MNVPSFARASLATAVLVASAVLVLLAESPRAQQSQPQSRPAQDTPAAQGFHSIFVHPMYLAPTPPELRTIRALEIGWKGLPSSTADIRRSRDDAYQIGLQLAAQLRAGVDFDALSLTYSSLPNARVGGVLGTFAPGMLGPQLDAFLFGADIGASSEPLETPRGWLVVQRVETHAAARTLMLEGGGDAVHARCVELLRQARAGADFTELARAHSQDKLTAARGGALAIFERGPYDALLKAAAFRLPIGAVSEPIESPLGWHLVQRVALDSLDASLAEPVWVRARAILVAQSVVPAGAPSAQRSSEHAFEIAQKLRERILGGEDMEQLARENCDDYGGRARGGDLGWIHRSHPNKLNLLDGLWNAQPGELLEPIGSTTGWVLLRREY